MAPAAHPLDPLSGDEITQAAAILRRDQGVGERWRFASIELREPSKDVVRDFSAGDEIRREAQDQDADGRPTRLSTSSRAARRRQRRT